MILNLNNKTFSNNSSIARFASNNLIGCNTGTITSLNTSVGFGLSFKTNLSYNSRNRPAPSCRARRLVSPQTNILLNKIYDLRDARTHALAAHNKAVRNNSTSVALPLALAGKNIIQTYKLKSLAKFFDDDLHIKIGELFHNSLSPDFEYEFIVLDGDGLEIYSCGFNQSLSLPAFTDKIYQGLYVCGASDFSELDSGADFYLSQKGSIDSPSAGVHPALEGKVDTSYINLKKGNRKGEMILDL